MLTSCWNTLNELSPWLLLGMLFSGALHVFLPEGFVRRRFRGLSGVIKSVGIGIPLPLCSCGVIPAGIGLKNQGASNGAAVGFLISTPQTGVDSLLVSVSFFGWPFAIFKMVAAAITGVIGGYLADSREHEDPLAIVGVTTGAEEAPTSGGDCCGSGGATGSTEACCEGFLSSIRARWKNHVLGRLISHAIDTFRSIWGWLVIGVLISAVIDRFMPEEWLATVGAWGLLPAMLLMLVVSAPLYVCATASVPIAAALVNGGLPPAAAIVFLMAGPATNVTTMGAIHQHFGKRSLAAYLGSIVIGSMIGAWMFHAFFPSQVVAGESAHTHQHGASWWTASCTILLMVLMLWFALSDLQKRFVSGDWQSHHHHH